jgi:hypothetical protein
LDPINPIGPRRSAQPDAIPAARRTESATEKRDRDAAEQRRRRRRAVVPDLPPPPDDGLPHIDVRV